MRVRSAMDGDTDGNRSERSRVRENMEVSGVRENIRDSSKHFLLWLYNKTSPKKNGFRPRVRNGA